LRSLEAFEKSEYADDWRELMSLFMVRRTRSFIRDNYATLDPETGRKYLSFADGSRNFFPTRHPKTVRFPINESDPNDQYARLYTDKVVDTINGLDLPRYGLGNYVVEKPKQPPNERESKILDDLSRGGRRLMGFCRTNLFKRLESSGHVFLLSVERHILRNFIFVHALENNLPLPIGTQGAEMLDPRFEDEDADAVDYSTLDLFDDDTDETDQKPGFSPKNLVSLPLRTEIAFRERAAAVYDLYATRYKRRFRWIRPDLFKKSLGQHLRDDAKDLLSILQLFGEWDVDQDAKLNALHQLLTETHPQDKVLVFSQFADTVHYLEEQLQARGVDRLAGVTGDSFDPTGLAWRFSPVSNNKREQISPDNELRVLMSTDVLSEGQNLQDGFIVVNYDLPWAIIRLVQRAGRVDRIGQKAPDILCYTFWPAEGVERIIRLRERLRQRLRENAEVVGTDELFFEDDVDAQPLIDLYHEKIGILDDPPDTEIDLVSNAYQIWKNATDANPELRTIIPRLPAVVYSTKAHSGGDVAAGPAGVLVYLSTTEGNSALAWMDENGNSVSESQFAVLRAAECALDTPALPRQENHHDLVQSGVKHIMTESQFVGGQLGRPSGARFRTYERLSEYARRLRDSLFESLPASQSLFKAVEQIYRFPLRESATERLNRQLRSGVQDEQLAELVVNLYEDDKLCLVQEEQEAQEPRIICSLGLARLQEEENNVTDVSRGIAPR
jgi:hypothetical protein